MAHAWIINKDHLFDPNCDYLTDEAGTVGPSNAPATTFDELFRMFDNAVTFYMYDDDGELYYTGKLFWDGDDEPGEEIIAAPLDDFGMPNAGCTRIKYRAKPGWEIG